MKKTILIAAIAILSMAFQTNAPIPREKHRVKMVIHYLYKDTSEYFYNTDGHISRIRNAKGYNVSYEYFPGKILRKYADALRGLNFTDTMTLNKKGLIEKLTSNNPSTIEQRRDYNSDKNMTQNKYYDKEGNETTYSACEYLGGNEVSNTMIDLGNNKTQMTLTSQYYTDKANTIGNENLGSDFTGSGSKNPIQSSTSRVAGFPTVIYHFNYHYDSKGRISIKATYDKDGKLDKLTDSTCYIYY